MIPKSGYRFSEKDHAQMQIKHATHGRDRRNDRRRRFAGSRKSGEQKCPR